MFPADKRNCIIMSRFCLPSAILKGIRLSGRRPLEGLADLDEWFDGQRFWQMAGQDEDYRELFVKPLQNVKEQSLNPALRNQEVKYE